MDFDKRRRQKWVAGRRERGLDASGAFLGDPAAELQEEMMDVANYADQLCADGDMSQQEADRYFALAREMFLHMEAVKARRADRIRTEGRAYHAAELDECYASA